MNRLIKAISAFLLLILMACSPEPKSELRIGSNVWPGYEPLYLAREMGLTDKNNIKLIEFSSSSQTLQAFRNEVIDGAALTLDEAYLLLQSGEDLALVLIMDISHGGDAIVAQANIRNMSDMAGKIFGVENNALGAYVLSRAVKISKLNQGDIKVISLAINEQKDAFLNKQVDAVVTFEPILSELHELDGHVIFDSRQIPGEIVDVLVIRRHYLERNIVQIKQLKNIWYQVLKRIDSHPKDTAKIMAKRLKLTPNKTLKSFQGLTLANKQVNIKWLTGENPKLLINGKRLMNIMIEKELLSGPVDYSSLIKGYE